ncbi:MAG: hypothetical protein ACJ8C4_17720 [Gemmataceae bacterium]
MEATATATTAVGVFDDKNQAGIAIDALKKAGFTEQQIGVASHEVTKHFGGVNAQEQHTAESGAIRGSLVGTGVGAVLGLAGASLIPGVLPFVAGSLLVSTLVGGAAGAAVGAFAGPFIALGMSEHEANIHAQHVAAGKTVLLVYAPDRRDEARDIMVHNGAYDDSMNASP